MSALRQIPAEGVGGGGRTGASRLPLAPEAAIPLSAHRSHGCLAPICGWFRPARWFSKADAMPEVAFGCHGWRAEVRVTMRFDWK